MKKITQVRSLLVGNGPEKLFLLLTAFFFTGLTSCSKEELTNDLLNNSAESIIEVNASYKAASSATTIEEITFSAVAGIEECHGENIAFTGTIQNRVSKTTDATGQVHYTRSFSTRGMTGTGTVTGTTYDVIGGAEMFAIKNPVFNAQGMLNIPGSLAESDIVIHQGTLVFQSRTDGSRVVARHIIRKVPGQKEWINKWVCAGK